MADVEQPGPGQGQSKSAKRRAAQKKAKEAGEAEAAPQNKENTSENKKAEPKAKPAAAPAEPKAKAKGKAKAEPKEEPKPKAQPKAEPKAEPKAAAKPAAKPAAKSDAAKPKGEAKSKAAAKAKAPAKVEKKEEEERPAREPSPQRFIEYDDGTGGDWETSTGITKKQQKRKERKEEEAAQLKAAGVKPGVAQNYVPGMGPDPKAGAKPAVSQSVSAPISAAATAAAVAEKEKEPAANTSTQVIKVPEARIGIVIGPKGAKIKMIQEKCAGVRIDTSGEEFSVSGPPDSVSQAADAIRELIAKGHCALEFEDFSEHFVAVHPSYFPEIIGKEGKIIRKLKEELRVNVNIPSDAPKNPPANKKYKVTLAGSAADVEKAKEVINDIVMYYHHPITHPDQVHEEVEVPNPWTISFIIGKGGCELRHIQKNFDVKMNVPRDQSVNKNVVIVGLRNNVDRAKAYVEKVLWNAEHAPRGRDRGEGGADDGWGDEEDVEDWMKDYLYKRK